MSRLVLAEKNSICRPSAAAADCTFLILARLVSPRKPMRTALGTSSHRSPSRLLSSSVFMEVIPVMLPPGRLKLATRPSSTGSPPFRNTIGIVFVAAWATRDGATPPTAAMTATLRPTRSAANSGSRSGSLRAKRYSIATLRPSTKPYTLSPLRNAASRFESGIPRKR
jgi:hypothetical protein